ncbi:PREDICTED: putative serine protease K12H4.7-like [Chrysochloris asiatica]|uniref:Serine protease K12H4.7-like n=1 Tax=Chrysochloris asiatica TaxID=185453 RepID=A0A9B0WP80_CHRAS|nr:PREDICTED: putative serine protease K12H4.7-like [Chrysochloris asiatica]
MAHTLRWLQLLLLLLFCFCAQSLFRSPTQNELLNTMVHPHDGWFRQRLDHFTQQRFLFWQQRYLINDTFYRPGGPVFLMLVGEKALNRIMLLKKYAWITYAERLGAFCILLEHRFYGHSQPTGDLTITSLQYLSSKQVLADIAYFRIEMGQQMRLTQNKWVVFGGSYAGILAVWSRIKYPNLFAAAVGSSAPLKAKVNFFEYFKMIDRILTNRDKKCSKSVKEAFGHLAEMVKHPEYYIKLKDDFNLCNVFGNDSSMDTAYFMKNLLSLLYIIVQKNVMNIAALQNRFPIDYFCAIMANTSLGSPYYRFAHFENNLLKIKNQSCFVSNYKDYLAAMSNPSMDRRKLKKDRQWLYQSCTEFGFFQTTDSKNHPFSGVPLRYFLKLCSDAFGLKFSTDSVSRAIRTTNRHYGGLKVNGSKIIFPNGSSDPWHVLGVTKNIREDLPAVFMKGNTVVNSQRPTNKMIYQRAKVKTTVQICKNKGKLIPFN